MSLPGCYIAAAGAHTQVLKMVLQRMGGWLMLPEGRRGRAEVVRRTGEAHEGEREGSGGDTGGWLVERRCVPVCV